MQQPGSRGADIVEFSTRRADAGFVTWKLRAVKPQAGIYAQAHFEELRAGWRRRVLPRLRLVFWPLIVLSLAGAALPSEWRWFAGSAFGALLTFWLYIRDAVPQHIERWFDGAEGERWTERQLRLLEAEGWHVVHDLEDKYGNIDHFVVGPAGAYLLDSKNWNGVVAVADGAAIVTPRDNPGAAWTPIGLARHMRGASASRKEALEASTGIRTWVQAVVVVWAPFPQRHAQSDGIAYVAGQALASWLLNQPRKLEDATISKLAAALHAPQFRQTESAR